MVGKRELSPETHVLELEPEAPLGFVGGQYVIVNTGIVLDGGKLAKRAYSILSPDARQDRIELAVRKIGAGPGSNYMHALAVGAELAFSGPWGQFLPDDAAPRRSWVLATDTGVTAALGLVRGEKFAPQRARARLLWLLPSADYFLPRQFVAAALDGVCEWSAVPLPSVGHPERVVVALGKLRLLLERERPDSVFLSGDGAVIHPAREALVAAGVAEASVRLEAFFNNPQKKSV